MLDSPFNRFILDVFSYVQFLVFLLLSVVHGIGNSNQVRNSGLGGGGLVVSSVGS